MDDPRRDDEPASKHLNDLLAAADARDTPDRPASAPVFRDADAFRSSPEVRPAARPPAFRGDAAFRDDVFEDPRDRATYGTSLAEELDEGQRPLAERGTRLAAQLLDGLAAIVIGIPILVGALIGALVGGDEAASTLAIVGMVVGFIAFAFYQLRLLAAEGQTIGKRAMKIRIVDIADGTNPGFARTFFVRGVVTGIIGAIPGVGPLFAMVNILFIFRDDRRCIHDHLAKTVVVKDAA